MIVTTFATTSDRLRERKTDRRSQDCNKKQISELRGNYRRRGLHYYAIKNHRESGTGGWATGLSVGVGSHQGGQTITSR